MVDRKCVLERNKSSGDNIILLNTYQSLVPCPRMKTKLEPFSFDTDQTPRRFGKWAAFGDREVLTKLEPSVERRLLPAVTAPNPMTDRRPGDQWISHGLNEIFMERLSGKLCQIYRQTECLLKKRANAERHAYVGRGGRRGSSGNKAEE